MTKEIRELGVDQLASVSGGGLDGISYLVAVSQKASNADDGARVQQQAHGQLSEIARLFKN